jgi:pyruvate/2-oxoglutarate dehydrogenase complex dihydrolipoamide dehydrogenase (E3) component
MAEVLTPDLCVIGAGTGGLAVAAEALRVGASVVVVERGRVGGSSLYAGSVASKALVEAARVAHLMREADAFGIATVEPRVDYARLRNHVRGAISAMVPASSAEWITAQGARVIAAEGRFIDPATLGAGEVLVRARRFVIATGAASVLPDIAGLDETGYFTSDTIFENARRPTHMAVVGAGATGLELGQAFRRLGADVTLIELATPLADIDPEFAAPVLRQVQAEGVLIRTGTAVPRVVPRADGGAVVTIASNGTEETISASHLLVMAGRLPNLDLDLERAGIRRSAADPTRLELSPRLRTSNMRVYAVGDAAGFRHSAELAAYQARVVVSTAYEAVPARYRPERVPFVLFTDPEVAIVGLTEAAARARFGDRFRVVRWPLAASPRAHARHQAEGLCKAILSPAGRLIGAGIVGPDAGEFIALFAFALDQRLKLEELARVAPPYPALAAAPARLAAEALAQSAPPPFQAWLTRLSRVLP